MSIVCSTCPLDFHRPPSVNSVPLSPLHKGTIVSAPSPLLFRALRVTCLRVVLGRYQRRSLTLFAFVQASVAEVIRYIRTSFLLFALDQVRSPANFQSIFRWHCAL